MEDLVAPSSLQLKMNTSFFYEAQIMAVGPRQQAEREIDQQQGCHQWGAGSLGFHLDNPKSQ